MALVPLDNALESFTSAALAFLRKRNEIEYVHMVQRQRLEFSSAGVRAAHWMKVYLIRDFIRKQMDEIVRLPEALDAFEALLNEDSFFLPPVVDNANNPIKLDFDASWKLVGDALHTFLSSYAERFKTLEFLPSNFGEHLAAWKSVWHTTQVVHAVYIPIVGVTSDVDYVEFADDVFLARFSPELKESLWNFDILSAPPIDLDTFAAAQFMLVYQYSVPNPLTSLGAPGRSNAQRAVLALRLLKFGMVMPVAYFDRVEPDWFSIPTSTGFFSDSRVTKLRHTPYRLLLEDVPHAQGLYHLLSELDHAKKLTPIEIGINRFDQALQRTLIEDRLVDLTIGLENMLLFGTRDELKYRLAVRGSALLAKKRAPSQVFALLRDLYDVRSGIVHEGKHVMEFSKILRKWEMSDSQFVDAVEILYREILVEYLWDLQAETMAEIVQKLDEKILEGLVPNPTCS